MPDREPLARTIARHRIIRTLVVYRAYIVMQLVFIIFTLIRHQQAPIISQFIGLLGYDGLLCNSILHGENFGYPYHWRWYPFYFVAWALLLTPLILTYLQRDGQDRFKKSRVMLQAIPISFLVMSLLCVYLSIDHDSGWNWIAQIHEGPLVSGNFIIAQSNATYPVLIMLLVYIVSALLLGICSRTDFTWLGRFHFNSALLIVGLVFYLVASISYSKMQSRTGRFVPVITSMDNCVMLIRMCLYWTTVYLAGCLFMLPKHASCRRILSQARYVGHGMYYPTADIKILLYVLIVMIQVFIFSVLLMILSPKLFGSYVTMSDFVNVFFFVMILSVPSLAGQLWAARKFCNQLNPFKIVEMNCRYCRYDLSGSLAAGTYHCPECGKPIPVNQRKHQLHAQRKIQITS